VNEFAFPVLETPPVAQSVPLPPPPQIDVEAIAEEARARGYADGIAQAAAELAPARDALLAAVDAVGATTDALERRAVELALQLAEKILYAKLDAEPELVCSVVAGALRRLSGVDRVIVEVNPEDEPLVLAAELRGIDVVPERRIARGGCIVRTGDGELDARIEEQLARAAAVLA
jgi:flagellar assembly protein FliH